MKKQFFSLIVCIILLSTSLSVYAEDFSNNINDIDISSLSIDELDELIERLTERRDELVALGLDLVDEEDQDETELPTPTLSLLQRRNQARTPTPKKAPSIPTMVPTKAPTSTPTIVPTKAPTKVPTKVPTKAPTKVPTKVPTKAPITLKIGSKGAQVTKLQKRLIALNWLSGKATGKYDDETAAAVKSFQKAAGLKKTGNADEKTREKLYASTAPKKKIYKSMNYKAVMRQPNKYKGKDYKITGYVLQVQEDDTYQNTLGIYTVLRIATKGKYDNVVYVVWWRSSGSSRILEDDKVTVCGTCQGIHTYTALFGNSISIPRIDADTVKIK